MLTCQMWEWTEPQESQGCKAGKEKTEKAKTKRSVAAMMKQVDSRREKMDDVMFDLVSMSTTN